MRINATPQQHRSPARPPAPSGAPELSVVIVNYNVREFLEQTLRSVFRAAEGLRVEVFVVDNNSVDGSVEMVRAHFPDVYLIANDSNVGFARANNQAIHIAHGRYVLVLNPDTILQEDTLRSLVAFMDARPEAGAVGCTILNPDGTFAPESRRAFPTPEVAFYRITGLSRLFPKSRRFGRYNMTYLPEDEVAEVDALSGSCMLVRRSALYLSRQEAAARGADAPGGDLSEHLPGAGQRQGAGLFDEEFFMYGEDLDWCYRIQEAGWKIYYTPETRIVHYKGESTKKGELRYVWLFYGAMSRFTRKHFHSRYSRVFAAALHAGIVVRAALTLLGNTVRRLGAPLLDVGLAFTAVMLVGLLRTVQTEMAFLPDLASTVAPGYALAAAAGVAAAGGYRTGRLARLRPVLFGAAVGLLAVASASFFLKTIAFSRAVVLVSAPVIALMLGGLRLARAARLRSPRRAILVGPRVEADRLRQLLADHPTPAFDLIGFVDREGKRKRATQQDPLRLGSFHHLRDLVRLRRVDDVIFSAAGLSNTTIFSLIQQLNGLAVQFRILAEGSRHVIGKASIEHLAFPSLLEAEVALGAYRHPGARRAFEVLAASAGLACWPLVRLLAGVAGSRGLARLSARLDRMPEVLMGRTALIGCTEAERSLVSNLPGLEIGVFALTESLPVPASGTQEIEKAYLFYTANRSVSLDLDILIQCTRSLLR